MWKTLLRKRINPAKEHDCQNMKLEMVNAGF